MKLRSLASAVTLAAVLILGLATSASAAPLPVTYSQGWSQAAVKPSWIRLGAGGGVMAHTWYWEQWNAKTAESNGTLWINKCVPDCAAGHYSYHKLQVVLSDVKTHDGRAYFSVMSWYTPGYQLAGAAKGTTAVMYYITAGGTIPGWTGCYPLSNEDGCYARGEFCRGIDRGKTGVDGDGVKVTCENKNGWRWE
jgi:hypothetical protein